MVGMFRCKHYGRLVKRNPRIKSSQRYCRQKECQQARKNAWELAKIKTDESYCQRRQASKKRWRRQHPAHTYQGRYRETHPEYVATNREKQKKRNEKPKAVDQLTKIVKNGRVIAWKAYQSRIIRTFTMEEKQFGKDCKDGRVNDTTDSITS